MMRTTPSTCLIHRAQRGLTAVLAGCLALGLALTAVSGPGARAQELPRLGDGKPARQKLVFAYYYYSMQGDTRKSVPQRDVRDKSGSCILTHHPWESVGPWLSYDRSQWHKNQFQMMAAGGIDVALAVFRGDVESRQTYAIKGLDVMAQGLKELRADGLAPLMKVREYPQIGLALDLGGLADQYGGPVNLKDADVQKSLYGMIKDFYAHIPEEFRATIQLPAARITADPPLGTSSTPRGAAYVVRLFNDAAVKDADGSFLTYVNRRFAQEFGVRLVWVGTPALQAKVPELDGAAPFPAANRPATLTETGWLRIGSLGPGYDAGPRSKSGSIRPRENGQQTILDFRKLMQANPDWIFIDSWNGYAQGTDVAPTLEYGLLYRDLLRAAVLQYKQSADYGADFLKASVPRVMQPGAIYQVDVIVQNSGTYDWDVLSGTSLSFRWRKNGKYVGDSGAVVPIGGLMRGEKKTFMIGVATPVKEGEVLPNGEYELELNLNRRVGNEVVWFDEEGTAPFRAPVTVGPAPTARPFWVNSTLPTLMKRDATYPATIRIRNDGNVMWKKGEVSLGYRWRKVSTYLKGAAADSDTVLGEGKRVPLAADVGPGRLISVEVPVSTVDGKGQPLLPWSPKEDWCYVLEWDVFDGKQYLSAAGGDTFREAVQVVDRDPAPSFVGCNLSAELVAGRTEKITVGLINNGPETWKKDRDKVAVHWYYMDGTEASWNDNLLPLQEDVPPFSMVEEEVRDDLVEKLFGTQDADKKKRKKGEKRTHKEKVVRPTVLREVPVRVPYYFGPMYCVFDFQHDGLNASTSPASKGNDILVIPVNVYSPTFTPLPIMAYYNVDGVSQDVNRGDANIDGRGNSLPAEFLPPYVPRPAVGAGPAPNPLYPSGLWYKPLNDLNSSRVCFLYPSKTDQAPNMMACQGQRIQFGGLERTAVHLLALSTAEDVTAEFTLMYSDGTSERKKLTFTHWNEPPKHGERVAFEAPHRHTSNGDDPTTRCYLNHYQIPTERLKMLIGVEMPRNPEIKIMAITLESAGLRSN